MRISLATVVTLIMASCSSSPSKEVVENAREEATKKAVVESSEVSEAAIIWTGTKITGASHTGTIDLKESALQFEGEKLVGGDFVVDMATLKNTDLEGEYNQKLVGHLSSDDFFGVETFPTAKFKITDVAAGANANEYNVTGDLTIKATTLSQSFVAKVDIVEGQAIATTNFMVNRTAFDIKYGSGSFFDGLGDKAINDDFNLDIRIVSQLGE